MVKTRLRKKPKKTIDELKLKPGDMVQFRIAGSWYILLYFQGMNNKHVYLRSARKIRQRNTAMNYRHVLKPIETEVINYGRCNTMP